MKKADAARSAIMRAVRSKDTKPELFVRSILGSLGFRYSLHSKSLPGKPDIVLSRLQKAVFVHGCFWHGHGCARGARVPKTNTSYWVQKVSRNAERDRKNLKTLKKMGKRVLVVWECETKHPTKLVRRIKRFLDS
ncbi:MAG: DNA mismatch endonuclease Vsr [Xanthobacteraceae bacterium]|nr:DNA mismatch endonuclease Vsr [Xanthobacteraceae bacterium]